jgi:hypothetical protein
MTHRDSVAVLSRRAVLALVPAAVFCAWSRQTTLAADPVTTPSDAFILMSKLLTGFPDVDPALATRLREAFLNVVPATSQAIACLIPIGLRAPNDSTLMMTARDAGLWEAALALVAAWYTGTVGSGAHTEVVAYADALMYRTVADGLAPPTYALGGPAWWVAAPPAAGVSPPIAEHAQPQVRRARKGNPS